MNISISTPITGVKEGMEIMNENMQQYLDKAQVLIEALPYIQRFNRKIIVVK